MSKLIAGNVIRRFDDYLRVRASQPALHPELSARLSALAAPRNLVIYGRGSVGKYYLALDAVRKFSPLGLQYEKMMPIQHNKKTYTVRMSDVHFEVDVQMLGTNSRLIWQTIFAAVLDIVETSITHTRARFIMLKNFQDVSAEMYELLLCYIDDRITKPANIQYIIVSEGISFFHDDLLNKFEIVHVPVPSEAALAGMNEAPAGLWQRPSAKVAPHVYEVRILESLVRCVDGFAAERCVDLRNILYDVLIYNIHPTRVAFGMMKQMMAGKGASRVDRVFFALNRMMAEYNNNYRPIIHLERFVLFLVDVLA